MKKVSFIAVLSCCVLLYFCKTVLVFYLPFVLNYNKRTSCPHYTHAHFSRWSMCLCVCPNVCVWVREIKETIFFRQCAYQLLGLILNQQRRLEQGWGQTEGPVHAGCVFLWDVYWEDVSIVITHPPFLSSLQPSARRTAVRSMDTARPQGAVHAVWVGRAPPAMNVFATQAASMGCAVSHGSVTVRRAGGVSSVTKTLTTAPTINPAQMVQPAPTQVRAATPALADLDLEAQTVSWKPTNVTATHARMEAVAMWVYKVIKKRDHSKMKCHTHSPSLQQKVEGNFTGKQCSSVVQNSWISLGLSHVKITERNMKRTLVAWAV